MAAGGRYSNSPLVLANSRPSCIIAGIMHFTNRASWEFMPVPADAVPLRRASFCDSILIDGAKREFPSASNDI